MKKTRFAIVFALALALVLAIVPMVTSADNANKVPEKDPVSVWYGDVDTDLRVEGNTYYIESAAELAGFAKLVNDGTNYFAGKTVKLTTDIALNDTANWTSWSATNAPANKWPGIGAWGQYFQGTFDGQGHTVSGVYMLIDGSVAQNNWGFFRVIGKTATVKDLNLKESGFFATSAATGNLNLGSLVGIVRDGTPTIENVSVSATVSAPGKNMVGGLFGDIHSDVTAAQVTGCSFHGTVSAAESVGGVVGLITARKTTITNCAVNATVSGTNGVGGISGYVYSSAEGNPAITADIKSCQVSGNVSGNNMVAGITGRVGINTTLTVDSCVNKATVTGTNEGIAGIVGRVSDETGIVVNLKDSLNLGAISSSRYTAGLFGTHSWGGAGGQSQTLTISGCMNLGTVSTTDAAFSGAIVSNYRGGYAGLTITNTYYATESDNGWYRNMTGDGNGTTAKPLATIKAMTGADLTAAGLGNWKFTSDGPVPKAQYVVSAKTAQISFAAKVGVTGKALSADMFTVNLYKVADNTFTVAEGATPDKSVKNDENGLADLGNFTLASGNHYYVMSQTKGDTNGISYDATLYEITVVVDDFGNITNATTVKGDGSSATSFTFTNTYTPDAGTLNLAAKVELSGRATAAQNEEFSFALYATDDTFAVAEGAEPLKTAKNDGQGNVYFNEVTAVDSLANRYYVIRQTSAAGKGVTPDTAEYHVTVTVQDVNTQYVPTASYTKAGATEPSADGAVYKNTYKATAATADIAAKIALTGRPESLKAEEFALLLVPAGATEDPAPVKNAEGGTVAFAQLSYESTGTYTYTIKQTPVTATGITGDQSEYTVTVTVTDDNEGTLSAAVVYTKGTEPVEAENVIFTNTYKAKSVSPGVSATVSVADKTMTAGEFSFSLTGDGNVNLSGTNAANGTVTLQIPAIERAGTYTYTLKQTATGSAGVTVDASEYAVTVVVTDESDGQLKAAVTYAKAGAPVAAEDVKFTNTYKAAPAVTVPVPSVDAEASVYLGAVPDLENGTLRTEGDKVYLDSANDLALFAAQVNAGQWKENGKYAGKTVVLTTDIVWNTGDADEWVAGNNLPSNLWACGAWSNYFSGNFDGQGHVISGLYGVAATDNFGFIGCVKRSDVSIKNLIIVNSAFVSERTNHVNMGGLVGTGEACDLTVENVYVDVNISAPSATRMGGIVGYWHNAADSSVTIRNAVFAGSVTGREEVGGIVGSMSKLTAETAAAPLVLENVLNLGTVQGGNIVGGFVGKSHDGMVTVTDALLAGTVNGTAGATTGAVVGQSSVAPGLSDVYATSASASNFNGAAVVEGDGILGVAAKTVLTGLDFTENWVVMANGYPMPHALYKLTFAPAPVNQSFSATVELEGKTLAAEVFSVTLYAEDGTTALFTVKNAADGKIALCDMIYDYTMVGTHKYVIKQDAVTDGTITADASVYNVTVVITDPGTGNLKADVTVTKGSTAVALNEIVFKNTYTEPTYDLPTVDDLPAPTDASVFDGTVSTTLRTEGNTVYIDSAADLAKFAEEVTGGNAFAGKTVVLTTDIIWNTGDADKWADGSETPEYSWICGKWGKFFHGTFDGQGHTISGLYNTSEGDNTGFLGAVGGKATVKNLILINSTFLCTRNGNANVGFIGVTGENTALTVDNCYVDANIVAPNGNHVGGILGHLHDKDCTATVTNTVFAGTVVGNVYVSGFVGYVHGSGENAPVTIENSMNLGTVQGNRYVGGFVGRQETGEKPVSVTDSVNAGLILGGEPANTGTIVGIAPVAPVTSDVYYLTDSAAQPYGTGALTGTSVLDLNKILGDAAKTNLAGITFPDAWTAVSEKVPLPTPVYNMLNPAPSGDQSGGDQSGSGSGSGQTGGGTTATLPTVDALPIPEDASVYEGKKSESLRTEGNTVYIDSAADLAKFAEEVNNGNTFAGKTLVLTTDIIWNRGSAKQWANGSVAPAYSWACGSWNSRFQGSFDGQGHTISGLYNLSDGDNFGFIGCVMGDVTVKNLILANSAFISTRENKQANLGGIIGTAEYANVIVDNVYAEVYLSAPNASAVGGIVGYIHRGDKTTLTLKNAVFAGTVTGKNYVGGLVGYMSRIKDADTAAPLVIENSMNLGTVTGETNVGGLLGLSQNGTVTITDSVNAGLVTGTDGATTGALVGASLLAPTVTDGYYLDASADKATGAGDLPGVTAVALADTLGIAAKTNLTGLTFPDAWTTVSSDVPLPTPVYNMLHPTVSGGDGGSGSGSEPSKDPEPVLPTVTPDKNASVYDGTVSKKLRNEGKTLYIDSAADLALFAEKVTGGMSYAGKTIVLTTDIIWNTGDADKWADGSETPEYSWTCGKWGKFFQGTFDGQGHVISGLYSSSDSDNTGFIGAISGNATVQNVALVNSAFLCTRKGNANMGFIGVTGEKTSLTVDNCYVDADFVAPNGNQVGGIVGRVHTSGCQVTVTNTVFAGTVNANDSVGGFIGKADQAAKDETGSVVTIRDSINLGTVTGNKNTAGFVGSCNKGTVTVETSINAGLVTCADAGSSGAFFGAGTDDVTLTDCVYVIGTSLKATGADLKEGVVSVAAVSLLDKTAQTTLPKFNFKKAWTAMKDGYPLPTTVYKMIGGVDAEGNPGTSDFIPVAFAVVGVLSLGAALIILRKKKTN